MGVGDERAVVGRPGDPGEAQAARRRQREQLLPDQGGREHQSDRSRGVLDGLVQRHVVGGDAGGGGRTAGGGGGGEGGGDAGGGAADRHRGGQCARRREGRYRRDY